MFFVGVSISFVSVVQAYDQSLRYPPPKSSSSGGGLAFASLIWLTLFYMFNIGVSISFVSVVQAYDNVYVTLLLNPPPREEDLLSLRSYC